MATIKIETKEGRAYSMDGYLYDKLVQYKNLINKDWDFMFVVDGMEGAGKSVFAQQLAKFLCKDFTVNEICFTPEEFIATINKAPKYSAIVFDEGMRGSSSRAAMSSVNRMLNITFAEMRQRNLFVIIVIPSFFEMDKYPAIHRSRVLFHITTTKQLQRGIYKAYHYETKKYLYLMGKQKGYSYSVTKPNYFGRFSGKYAVDEEAYRKKKHDSLKQMLGTDASSTNRREDRYRNICLSLISFFKARGINTKEVASAIGEKASFFYDLKRYHEKGKGINTIDFEKRGNSPLEVKEALP
jgi:hypothetical protein